MRVYAIVVTCNSRNVIRKCLISLRRGRLVPIVTVIDNNSQDETRELVAKEFPQIKIVTNAKNQGYARANNQGIEIALQTGCDFVLVINPDVVVEPDTLSNLVAEARKNVQHIYAPVLYQKDKKTLWAYGGVLDQKRYSAKLLGSRDAPVQRDKLDFISGTCMLIPQAVLTKGLRFYEPYFMYYEDVEFSLKATRMGFAPYVVKTAIAIHDEQSAKEQLLSIKQYYLARNHLLFVERNAPVGVQLREFIRLPKTFFQHHNHKEFMALQGLRDYFLRKFGHYGT